MLIKNNLQRLHFKIFVSKTMKIFKIILIAVFVVILAVAAILGISVYHMDSIVETAIEEIGPQVTHTEVTVDKVHLSVVDGLGEIKGLTIGNPEGYSSDYVFHLGHVALQIEPKSLLDEVYVIKQVTVDGAKIIAEQKALTTNLQTLLKNIEKSSASNSTSTEETTEENESVASSEVKKEPQFMVEKIDITNNSVKLVTERWGERELTMPDIQMADIGTKEQGVTAKELANMLVKRVTREADKWVKKELETIAKEKAKKKLGGKIKEKLNSLFGR